MDENKYSELLTYYLDGELDPAMEQELFGEIAENPELQSEMNDMLSIRDSIQSEIYSERVPNDATTAVFSAIGIGMPQVKPIAGTKADKRKIHILRYASVLLVIGAFAFLYFNNADKEEKINTLEKKISNLAALFNEKLGNSNDNKDYSSQDNIASGQSKIPVVSSFEKVPETKNYANRNNQNTNTADMITGKEEEVNKAIPANSTSMENTLFGKSRIEKIQTVAYKHGLNVTGYPNSIGGQYTGFNFNPASGAQKEYTIYISGINPNSFPAHRFDLIKAEPLFSHINIGFFRSFDELAEVGGFIKDIKFGIEFGQEPFKQEFYQNEHNYTKTAVQNPMIFWCAAACRIDFNMPGSLDGIQLYSKVAIGGSEQGPMLKMQTGLQYYILEGIGVNLGLEGSSMFFSNQSEWYSAEKLSLIYGMSIKF